ncbi:helix-turn-helix domain-containing protein [Calothrix sp. PCC 6303]|uniref:helix-turn-helix domain-containing protein n=1 Tax=Calothrix sp. PCC 6303 TaxID=1170562 RepID=UPI0002A032EC|nr:helix-turn-helix transcriptional regulator [Calothrix sp. PCC 6303]AFZ02349.1 helix-turn-helix domain protein [Calothrix sp. PCC 6303]
MQFKGDKVVLTLFGERVRVLRQARSLSQEALALAAELDRTYIGGVERGERNISLLNIQKIAQALDVSLTDLLQFEQKTEVMREPAAKGFLNAKVIEEIGLSHEMLRQAIRDTYKLLDQIDATLETAEVFPLSQTVELANLSSMIGNIFASAIAKHSNDLLRRNRPHRYPDLLTTGISPQVPDLELKMALETNKPKGHLAKEGYYLICRYVLCQLDGSLQIGKEQRGIKPYIWEIRCGYLLLEHFNLSNTAGDSGKTAVVNAAGMEILQIVYCDLERAPLSRKGKTYQSYQQLFERN